MKILLDANLSWRLIKALESQDIQVQHVNNTVLPAPASDQKIWEYARVNEYIIITKDHDFIRLSEMHGSPPQVVVIKRQNMPWQFYGQLLREKLPDIRHALLTENVALVEIL